MRITIYDKITPKIDRKLIDDLWQHNGNFFPIPLVPLRVLISNDANKIIGGLIGQTWWKGLEIQYLLMNNIGGLVLVANLSLMLSVRR